MGFKYVWLPTLTCFNVCPHAYCLPRVEDRAPLCLVGRRGRAQLTLAAESSPSVIVQVPLAEEGRQEVMQRRKRQQMHLCLQSSEAQLFKCCVCSQSSLWQGLPLMMGVQYGMTCKAE